MDIKTRSSTRLARHQNSNEVGSILPLILGLFILLIAVFMLSFDIYTMKVSRLKLESLGEELLSSLYTSIDYESYYFDSGIEHYFDSGIERVPFSCSELLNNFENSIVSLTIKVKVVSQTCENGRLSMILGQRVELPFLPNVFHEFQPEVRAYISGEMRLLTS